MSAPPTFSRPSLSRRRFLRNTAASIALPAIIPARVRGAEAPSKKVHVGFIGVGDHGTNRNLRTFLQQPDARAIAVCDVFRSRREAAKGIVDTVYAGKDCMLYGDFREMLARDDIDAVMISTPDHWHALISAMALRAGKDVICEKPTLTIAEGRFIADLVKKSGRVFQTSCRGGEHRNFLDCIKTRKEPYFPAEVGHRCATLCHLGNIAMQTGRKLNWDATSEQCLNDAEANASPLMHRPMRGPWSLENS